MRERGDPPIRTGDDVADLLANGKASSVSEAEELYLDARIDEILRLVESDLPDPEFRSHPLIALLFARGSRSWEDGVR
jgi:hypothetical protein